jgi:hypothetical protein
MTDLRVKGEQERTKRMLRKFAAPKRTLSDIAITCRSYFWCKQLWNRNHTYRHRLTEPDAWLEPKSFQVHWEETPRCIPLTPGDSLAYSTMEKTSLGKMTRHPMIYMGKGFVVGMVMQSMGVAKINVEFLEDCLKDRNVKQRPTIYKISPIIRPTVCERLLVMRRVVDSSGFLYRYNIANWNCQNMHEWWTGISDENTRLHILFAPCIICIVVIAMLLYFVYLNCKTQRKKQTLRRA